LNTGDIQEIFHLLPHRYPFLLVDRIVEHEKDHSLLAVKNVTANEPFFQGHFPGRPVMPGVLIIEALAQAAGLLTFRSGSGPPDSGTLFYLAGVDKARFKRPVYPGDQLMLRVELTKQRRRLWRFNALARVDGEVSCSAEITCVPAEVGAEDNDT
jgi:3-hydroxyacyl-[acyl-carrier-protein] dehydratase